jgi:DNA-binding transcriptional LysR family regulator
VVAPKDHFVTAAPEVALDDLVDEQLVRPHASGWTPRAEQLAWPAMTEREAVEVVASGSGIALLPMSVARLYHRKDVATRPVTDLEPSTVALAWLVARDADDTQAFVGVVKGRTANSSR